MPLYDYRCPQCGLAFEVSRPFSRATEPAHCPRDGTEAERVFSVPMTFVPGSATDATSAGGESPGHGHSHDHGHTHGPGGHSH